MVSQFLSGGLFLLHVLCRLLLMASEVPRVAISGALATLRGSEASLSNRVESCPAQHPLEVSRDKCSLWQCSWPHHITPDDNNPCPAQLFPEVVQGIHTVGIWFGWNPGSPLRKIYLKKQNKTKTLSLQELKTNTFLRFLDTNNPRQNKVFV